MKSKLTKLRLHIYESMTYITGYKVEVLDNLPPEVLHFIHTSKDDYMTPVQMMCLLQWADNRQKYDDPKLEHRFRDFIHKDEFMFPGLVINGEMAIKYNIPQEPIFMEKIKDDNLLNKEIERIFAMQEDYYANYPEGCDKLKTLYYPTERARVPRNPLPNYMVSEAEQLRIRKANQDRQLSIYGSNQELRKEDEKSYRRTQDMDEDSQESLNKIISEIKNLNPPPVPFDYDRNAARLHIPEPGKIPAPAFTITQYLMQTIIDKYHLGLDATLIGKIYQSFSNESGRLKTVLSKDYEGALGARFNKDFSLDVRKIHGYVEPLGYYYYLYIGENPNKHLTDPGQLSCTKDMVIDKKGEFEVLKESINLDIEYIQRNIGNLVNSKDIFEGDSEKVKKLKSVVSVAYERYKLLIENDFINTQIFFKSVQDRLQNYINLANDLDLAAALQTALVGITKALDKINDYTPTDEDDGYEEDEYDECKNESQLSPIESSTDGNRDVMIHKLEISQRNGESALDNILHNPIFPPEKEDNDSQQSGIQSFTSEESQETSTQSTTRQPVQLYLSTLSERGILQLLIATSAVLYLYEDFLTTRIEHMDTVISYIEARSSLKQINELMEGKSGYKPGYSTVHFDDPNEDILLSTPQICNSSDTRRFTTKSPNMQGKSKTIKQVIRGRAPGREVADIDIKGQELTILICGAMSDEELQRYYYETGDGYKAFGMKAGISADNYTPQTKEAIKVPVLASMNGGDAKTIRSDLSKLNYENLADPLLKIFNRDEKYQELVSRAEQEAKLSKKEKRPVNRRGMFGTVVPATKEGKFGYDYGTRKRQALNSNFQLTASEIISYCLHAMIYDLIHKTNKWGFSLEQITPILPVYDEMVFDIDSSLNKDDVKDFILFYMAPQIGNWAAMRGEITFGDHYVGK